MTFGEVIEANGPESRLISYDFVNTLLPRIEYHPEMNVYEEIVASLTSHETIECLKMIDVTEEEDDEYIVETLDEVCKHNVSHRIIPLIKEGESFLKMNRERQTPLHVALSYGSKECIKEFQELFRTAQQFSEKILKHLKYLLEVYDADGYTVLHRAVLNNELELVRAIIEFALQQGIDVMSIEALGYGHTILHLAVQAGLPDVARLIRGLIPNSVKYENYAGDLPYGSTLSQRG